MSGSAIFLDVGAHEGQTLEEVTKQSYDFDHIHAFEPMPQQFATLVERFGHLSNVSLHNFGLADRTGEVNVFGCNDQMEASIYSTKVDVDETVVTPCWFDEASSFLTTLPTLPLIVKLNCEGSEVPILNNLIDTGLIWKVSAVMIDFDIRKVDGYEDEEIKLLDRLRSIGYDHYTLCEQVMVGKTHQDRIANWLRQVL